MVLAAANDPFTTRYAKARRDAVLRIRVANISLQAPRGIVIPKPNRRIVRGGKNVFGVGRELDMLADSVVAFCEGFKTLAVYYVPNSADKGVC